MKKKEIRTILGAKLGESCASNSNRENQQFFDLRGLARNWHRWWRRYCEAEYCTRQRDAGDDVDRRSSGFKVAKSVARTTREGTVIGTGCHILVPSTKSRAILTYFAPRK